MLAPERLLCRQILPDTAQVHWNGKAQGVLSPNNTLMVSNIEMAERLRSPPLPFLCPHTAVIVLSIAKDFLLLQWSGTSYALCNRVTDGMFHLPTPPTLLPVGYKSLPAAQ